MKMTIRKNLYFHPFLFAAYPVITLLAANLTQVYYIYTLRSLFLSLGVALVLFIILSIITKNLDKSALITSILLVFFFSYGHVLYFLRANSIAGFELGRHHILIIPYLLIFSLLVFLCIRTKTNLKQWNNALNLISLVLVLVPLGQILFYYYQSGKPVQEEEVRSLERESVYEISDKNTTPDIYYIILDGYARQDKLMHEYGYDNQEFITELRNMGFYVADCNRSNYNITDFSMASSLNMNYLTEYGDDFRTIGNDREKLPSLISNNKVRRILESAGYQIYAYETGYYFTEWWDADTFLAPDDHFSIYQSLRPFEAMLLRSTLMLLISDSQVITFEELNADINFPYQDHVKRVRYALDTLPTLASVNGPKFVFVHILVPHKPLVFDSQGNIQSDSGFYSNTGDPIDGEYFQEGYLEEIDFINSKMPAILDQLINQSEVEPIILLNSDHGVWWGVLPSHANLGAYYLPDGGDELLYSHISNVNTFRIVFNRYFAADYELLPDVSYNLDDSSENGFSIQPEYLPGCMTE